VGNGANNDTAALNAAFQAGCSRSDSVYLPTGVYLVDPLAPLNGCGATFYGDGASSIIRFRANLARYWQALLSFGAGAGKTLTIHDLALEGTNAKLAGLSIDGYSAVALTSVSISNFGTPGYAQGHHGDFDGLYAINSASVIVKSSSFTGNERSGVELQAVHNSLVSDSVMSNNGRLGGVSEQNFAGPLDGPMSAKWQNNTLVNNGSGGIDVETDGKLPPAEAIFEGNHVIDCGNNMWDSGWGLVIGEHSFGRIEGNEVTNYASKVPANNYTNAIVYGNNGGPIQILNNTVTGTKSFGIVGNSGLFPVTITGNTLTANGTGVFIYQSPNVQITGNTVTNSVDTGIAVFWSEGASIGGNQFTANKSDLMVNGRPAAQ
jgi:parallel beta-helix repeat protein